MLITFYAILNNLIPDFFLKPTHKGNFNYNRSFKVNILSKFITFAQRFNLLRKTPKIEHFRENLNEIHQAVLKEAKRKIFFKPLPFTTAPHSQRKIGNLFETIILAQEINVKMCILLIKQDSVL